MTKRAERLTARAYRQLLWECYAPVLALGVCLLLLFIVGASSGLWQFIGDPWRGVALAITLAVFTWCVLHARKRLKPNTSQARRRVELDNNFKHRPFDTITDSSALVSSGSDDIAWQHHLDVARAQVNQAAPSRLRPALAPMDKYYLRFAVPCLVVAAAMFGGGDNYERIRASLTPGWMSGISAKNAAYEAWIDPPEYTNRPPSYFKKSNTIHAPEGSEFVARISGVKSAPRLIIREKGRTRRIRPTRLGPKSFEARAYISKSAKASFRIGSSSQIWILNVGADLPPSIEFDKVPEAGKRDKLIFTYSLKDDFGVESVMLSMHLKGQEGFVEEFPISIPGSSVRSTDKEPANLDMTKHKWAGKIVLGHLIATDGKGQSAKSSVQEFIIPDKIFVEPLAKAVAEQRLLMLAGTQAYAPLPILKPQTVEVFKNKPLYAVENRERTILRAPKNVQRTAELIEIVTDQPVGIFDDPSVYMGLRNVYRRLQGARNQDALVGIPEDLWTIALRAEFGRLGDALADMQAAERALNNAMARRAPQREIDTLFDRYEKAVERYMEELMLKAVEEAKKRDKNGDGEGGDEGSINQDEIQKLMDAIAEANRIGDTQAARKALAQLAELLEHMQINLDSGEGGDGPSDDSMSDELKQALEELNDLLGEQRQLRDETQSAGREDGDEKQNQDENSGQENGTSEGGTAKSAEQLADEQADLNALLDALEDNLEQGISGDPSENGEGGGIGEDDKKKIEQALRDAKDAMAGSQDALENGQYFRAGRAQSEAIDALRKAGQGLYAQEEKRLAEENEKEGKTASDEGDPFGRENDGNGVGDDVVVPDIDDRQRARDLLEQLRKRSGEQEREQIERDYLERLLERF